MTLQPGTRLGPYEVVAPLGAGGMGEVWRARDARLGRDVAIKALPAAFSSDPERVARFEREAKALASLLHPNIGAIFGLEDAEGARFLVLEYIEGDTLSARLARGPLPVDEAMDVCAQIAAAVEAAHEAGIVHRDLKPGNVMLRLDGVVKVLDFGLAKANAADSGVSSAALANSPTMTYAATAAGVILGTAAYMSPEQARGKPVDRRTDIWSFGCVLFECLSGRQVYEGETVSDLVARILERDPDWNALPASTPPAVTQLLRRCLTKDAKARLRDIGEARITLGEARAPSAVSGIAAAPAAAPAAPPRRTARAPWLPAAIAVVALAAGAIGGAQFGRTREAASRSVRRLSILPPSPNPSFGILGTYAVSPDGGTLAFIFSADGTSSRLYMQDLASQEAHPLDGTEGAQWPFWSPDSRDIGFFAQGSLCRVPAGGGAVRRLCPAMTGRGGAWGTRGTIVFSPEANSGIWAVDAEGGTPRQITKVDPAKGVSSHRWPCFLPDGRHFVYAENGAVSAINAPIVIAAVDDPTPHRICESATAATFAAPDRILFTHDDALLSQRLDMRRWTMRGEPALLRDQPINSGPVQLLPRVSCSATGVMVYPPKDARPYDLVELGAGGERRVRAQLPPSSWGGRLSPDGSRVAVSTSGGQGWGSLVLDLASGAVTEVAKMGRGLAYSIWSRDGRSLIGATMAGLMQIDVATGAESLFTAAGPRWTTPSSWTPDGKALVVSQQLPGHGYEILILPVDPPGPARPWLATPALERHGHISHDGRLIVYQSDALGAEALFVDTYPMRSGAARGPQVGNEDLSFGGWSADDREVYFVGAGDRIVAVPVLRGAHPSFGAPRVLTTLPPGTAGWQITADGRQLLLLPHGELQPSLTLVDGWMREKGVSR